MAVCIFITSRMLNQLELLELLVLELDLTATEKLNVILCLPCNGGQCKHIAPVTGKLNAFVLLWPKSLLIEKHLNLIRLERFGPRSSQCTHTHSLSQLLIFLYLLWCLKHCSERRHSRRHPVVSLHSVTWIVLVREIPWHVSLHSPSCVRVVWGLWFG